MPQIGWFEILIIVGIAIIVIGPKDFPIMLKKIGSWIGSAKRYVNQIQQEVTINVDNENETEEKKKIIKQDKSRVPFDETKLKEGIARSLEKRPVSQEDFLKLIEDIKKEIRSLGEREIPSKQIGETVMKFLRKIDEVAFVRFASVYRSFQDPLEFSEEVKRLSDD